VASGIPVLDRGGSTIADAMDEIYLQLVATLRKRQRILEMQRGSYSILAVPPIVLRDLKMFVLAVRGAGWLESFQRPLTFWKDVNPFFFGRDALVGELFAKMAHTLLSSGFPVDLEVGKGCHRRNVTPAFIRDSMRRIEERTSVQR
jgi:hypothetical protein